MTETGKLGRDGARQVHDAQTRDARIQEAKSAIAARLRYIRQHHPEGPFTLAGLAGRAGVSKRTLSQAESAEGSNLTIETLVKVAHSLGISRDGYFLDAEVFQEVNSQLATLTELEKRQVRRVAMRNADPSPKSAHSYEALSGLIAGILKSATEAQGALSELPHSGDTPSSNGESAS
nr:helix-turn-helix domain-containing protein [Streptomyces sp. NBC_00857]